MRILLLTETIPYPLDSGGRIKTYHTLRSLSADHEVHCHAFIRDERQRSHATAVLQTCASLTLHLVPATWRREARAIARSAATGAPFTMARHFDRSVLDRIRLHTRTVRFDAGYYDHLSMLEYARHLDLPVIHDAHNVEFELLRRYAATLGLAPVRLFAEREWRLVRAFERRQYALCDMIFAVSDRDARSIRSLVEAPPDVRVLPIAVGAREIAPVSSLTSEPALLFVGGLHWPPNADAIAFFVRQIWPLVLRDTPAARLTVVGRADAPVAKLLRSTRGVEVAGYVDDIGPSFERARAVIVPLRSGGGMRVKILETLARAVPVVSTSIGLEGIDAVPGRHLLVADDPEAFAREVARVFRDDSLARSLASEGRRLVLERYDSAVVGRALRQIIAGFRSVRPAPNVQRMG